MKRNYNSPCLTIYYVALQQIIAGTRLQIADAPNPYVEISSDSYSGVFGSRASSDNIWDDEE